MKTIDLVEKKLTCKVTNAPVRLLAKDSAEIVTQILYGELVVAIEHGNKDWIKISCDWDNYQGWVDRKQFKIEEIEKDDKKSICLDKFVDLKTKEGTVLVGLGSIISRSEVDSNIMAALAIENIDKNNKKEIFRTVLEKYVGVAYLWGGRSISGIDCSGLVQVLFSCIGVKLPRDASMQATCGDLVISLLDAKEGDLAFFVNDKQKVVHVGIIIDNNRIVHAAGYVRIDKLLSDGIVNKENEVITHKLSIIKRITNFKK